VSSRAEPDQGNGGDRRRPASASPSTRRSARRARPSRSSCARGISSGRAVHPDAREHREGTVPHDAARAARQGMARGHSRRAARQATRPLPSCGRHRDHVGRRSSRAGREHHRRRRTRPGKRRVQAAASWQPYSVKIGDTYYNYQRLQPVGTLIGMAADVAEVWDHMTEEESDKVPKMLAGRLRQRGDEPDLPAGHHEHRERDERPDASGRSWRSSTPAASCRPSSRSRRRCSTRSRAR
jgi:hypothetical protein